MFARQLESHQRENQSLRAQGFNLSGYNSSDAELGAGRPRKIARNASKSKNDDVRVNANKTANANGPKQVAVSTAKVNDVTGKKASEARKNRKIFQVVEANVFKVRKCILDAACGDFDVKQNSGSEPVKVSVGK